MTIYTIGTQGMHDTQFLEILHEHQIDIVVDVRLRNEGRYYKFASGKHIQSIVESAGIAYRHELVFAPTSVMLKAYKKDKNWEAYKKAYDNLITERKITSLWNDGYREHERPCLLCAEDVPDKCHRRLLAEHLGKVFGVPIIHLGEKVRTCAKDQRNQNKATQHV